MRTVASMLLFLVLGVGVARAEQGADPWLGRDKALHAGVSAGLAAGGYGASALVFERRSARLLTGAGLALTLGAAKELHDLRGYGHASWRDMTWNVAGTGAGLLLAWSVDRLLSGRPSERTPRRAALVPLPGREIGLALRLLP